MIERSFGNPCPSSSWWLLPNMQKKSFILGVMDTTTFLNRPLMNYERTPVEIYNIKYCFDDRVKLQGNRIS